MVSDLLSSPRAPLRARGDDARTSMRLQHHLFAMLPSSCYAFSELAGCNFFISQFQLFILRVAAISSSSTNLIRRFQHFLLPDVAHDACKSLSPVIAFFWPSPAVEVASSNIFCRRSQHAAEPGRSMTCSPHRSMPKRLSSKCPVSEVEKGRRGGQAWECPHGSMRLEASRSSHGHVLSLGKKRG